MLVTGREARETSITKEENELRLKTVVERGKSQVQKGSREMDQGWNPHTLEKLYEKWSAAIDGSGSANKRQSQASTTVKQM